ncbi:MAG: DUF86 domain-containing protein [Parvularculaceae bacterium]|nr:DUF86 domain-containing protein [Parvularculaceae bacterium]
MRRDAIVYLEDIRLAACDVAQFAKRVGEGYHLDENLLVRLAVERQLITAGEAVSQLAKFFPEVVENIPDWRQIISFRNILVHGYRAIDHDLVFAVIHDRVPVLLAAVEALIAEFEDRT